jgi:hypothetical protein
MSTHCKVFAAFLMIGTLLPSTAFAEDDPMTFQMIEGKAVAFGSFQPDSNDAFTMFLLNQGHLGDLWNVPLYITSGGGALDAALSMGRIIREHGMSVVAHQFCASACTYMMYGGVQRVVTKGTQFGVHQVSFTPLDADPELPRYSNEFMVKFQKDMADLHDYTRDMGVDTQVVSIASRTAPADVTWLTREQLISLNIDNTPSADPEGQTLETISIPGVTEPVDLPELVITELYNQVSPSNGEIAGLRGLAQSVAIGMARRVITAEAKTEVEMEKSLLNSYALNVEYNGTNWSPAQILAEKRRMIQDWGVRRRSVEEDTLKVTCTETASACTVTGIYNSELGLAEDGFISKARWNFAVDVILPMSLPRVARETQSLVE